MKSVLKFVLFTAVLLQSRLIDAQQPGKNNPVITDTTQRYYAVLVAEGNYTDAAFPHLQNTLRDAMELKDVLMGQYGFIHIDTVFNKNREEILEAITRRCNALSDDDNLLIFYAGHGMAEKDKYGGVDSYWIPVSAKKGSFAGYIHNEDVNSAIKYSNAKHILVVCDNRYGGEFSKPLSGDAAKDIQKQNKALSRTVMTGGMMNTTADNSMFISSLKKMLKENTQKFLPGRKLINSFYSAVSNPASPPQYAAIMNVGDEGGEFVFIKK